MIVPPDSIAQLKAGEGTVVFVPKRPHEELRHLLYTKPPRYQLFNTLSRRARYYEGRRYGVRKDAGSRVCLMVMLEQIQDGGAVWKLTLRPCGKGR